jgi:cell division protein ZapA (FtsZ GTPase activity inhibitor)
MVALMTDDKVKEIEEKIADLKARWPPHSVPPSMWQQLEELEDELEEAKRVETGEREKQGE